MVLASVAQLQESSVVRRDFQGGRLLGVRLEENGTARFSVAAAAELGAFVSVPRELLQVGGGEPLALVMTLLDEGSLEYLDPSVEVLGPALALDVATLAGRLVSVQGLEAPIVLELPLNYTKGMACAFWDGKGWSKEGLLAGEGAEGRLRCETRHLTVFAGIWEGFRLTLECSHVSLFSEEAVRALVTGDWYVQTGAQLFWGMLALLTVTLSIAAVLDWRRRRWFTWTPEFFLVPLHDSPQPEPEAEHGSRASLCAGWQWQESTWKNCLDEVISEWFEYFADLRSLLETTCGGLELGSDCRLRKASRRWATKAVSASSKRLAGASTGLSNDVVTFLLEDQDFTEYIGLRRHSRARVEHGSPSRWHLAALPSGAAPLTPESNAVRGEESTGEFVGRQASVSWKAARTREEAWIGLHEEICAHLPRHVARHSWRSLPMMVTELFWVHNPICGTFHIDIFSSCKLRALLLIVELSSTLFVTSLFFSATGTVKGRKRQRNSSCYDSALQGQLDFKIGRVLAVAMGAILLSWIPTTLLASLHTVGFRKVPFEGCRAWARELATWKAQDRLIYILGSLYTAFCLFFTALFLANVSDDAHANFGVSCLLSFLQDAFFMPLALSFVLPMAARLLLGLTSRFNERDRVLLIQEVYKHIYETTNALPPIVGI